MRVVPAIRRLPKLLLTVDTDPDQSFRIKILRAIEIFEIDKRFSDIEIKDCEMSASENIYIRHGQKAPASIPKFGYKSGPNSQFLSSLLHLTKEANTLLLNEVDCYPIREDWYLSCQHAIAGSEPFWILGSPYRGRGRVGPEVVQHINGNAFYGIGLPGANNFFFNLLANEMLHRVKSTPDLAYDVVFSAMFQEIHNPTSWSSASQSLFRLYPQVATRVRATDLIHNLAGTEEIVGTSSYDVSEYARKWPSVQLVHGGFLKTSVVNSCICNWNSFKQIPARKKIAFAERLWAVGQKAASRKIVESISNEKLSTFPLPKTTRRIFAFSLHESGGDGFYRLLSRVADYTHGLNAELRLRYESIPDELYQLGISESSWKDNPAPTFLGERLIKTLQFSEDFDSFPAS